MSFTGDELLQIRDRLCLDLLGWRQILRDMPVENLTEAAQLLADTYVELLRLSRKS